VIIDAARRLFEDGGYTATAVPSIAAEAGVAVKTVYLAFETKAGLLRAVWEARLGGEEEAIPVLERRWMRELTEEADPVGKLRLLAAQSRRVKTATGRLLEAIRTAAATDPEVAPLWQDIEAKLLRVQRAVVDQLDALDALRPSLDARGHRHPVDAQPPDRLASARPRTGLAACQLRAVALRRVLPTAARHHSASLTIAVAVRSAGANDPLRNRRQGKSRRSQRWDCTT
jgi:AcrR family transcriptional regulator